VVPLIPHQGPCNDLSTGNSSIPGGIRAGPLGNEECTLGPRMIPGGCKPLGRGWSIPAHCLTSCHDVTGSDNCTSTRTCEPELKEDIFHNTRGIGRVICYDLLLDFAFVEHYPSSSSEPEIVLPSNHSDKVHIRDSVSDSGLDHVLENKSRYDVTFRGISSCKVAGGTVQGRDFSKKIKDFCTPDPDDNRTTEYQVMTNI